MPYRIAAFAAVLLALAQFCGCVKRQIIITSEPAGARVYLDGIEVGRTPTSVAFEFYGVREIVLRKPAISAQGYYYPSRREVIDLAAPWYEYFPIDFIPDVAIPFTIYDRHEFHFKLEKRAPTAEERDKEIEELFKRADELRRKSRGE